MTTTRYSAHRRRPTALALMLLCAAGTDGESAQPAAKRRMPVEIRLELGQDRFLKMESMVLRILIRNTGSRTISVPNPESSRNSQPRYTVRGPSYAQPFTFTAFGPEGARLASAEGSEADIVEIKPRDTRESLLPLEQSVDFPRPGLHSIEVTLDWQGLSARSAPVPFTIEEPRLRDCVLAIDDGAQPRFPIRSVCLHQGENQKGPAVLYQPLFHEQREELGEIRLAKLVAVPGPGEPLSGVIPVWANFNRFSVLMNIFAWRSGATFGVHEFSGGRISRWSASGTPPRSPVFPALVRVSGEVEMFLLSEDGRELSLVRFPRGGDGVLVWTTRLNEPARISRATLAPPSLGGAAAAVFYSDSADGIRATLVESTPIGPLVRIAEARQVRLFTHSEPALRVADNGSVRSSVVVARDAEARSMGVVDFEWLPKQEGKAEVSNAIALTAPAYAAAVAYPSTANTPLRRDWVAVLSDETLVSSRTDRPRRLRDKPVLPVQLLALRQMSYILTTGGERVLWLELVQ